MPDNLSHVGSRYMEEAGLVPWKLEAFEEFSEHIVRQIGSEIFRVELERPVSY